ncbi:DUF4388 domain-containing protein [Mastigocladopsis repens]|uniref:DUF4388 domain-containing protein n=1 Tax=Mastigocladopsis repens TaxID=221287 RepID=UPI0002F26F5C|nr:DUF4388 domain-containing protein [Mastigocladopsis repens]
MAFTGNLAEFSLPKIFQFLEQGNKTGLLTIRILAADLTAVVQVHYIWLHQGRIVAAADRLDQKGLVSMVAQRGWVSEDVAMGMAQLCPVNTPIGLCLKFQGLLQAEQLKLLFRIQVVEQVSDLFELKDGQFEFDAKATLPLAEMTGMSLPATEATLIGLRTLRDWNALAEKLPDPTSVFSSRNTSQPQLQLDSLEWQVWQLMNSTISLREIATQLGLAVEKVQQIAFRLLMSNLAEEVCLTVAAPDQAVAETTPIAENLPEPVDASNQTDDTQVESYAVAETTPIAENLPEPVDASNQINVHQSFLQKLGSCLGVIRSFFQWLFGSQEGKI